MLSFSMLKLTSTTKLLTTMNEKEFNKGGFFAHIVALQNFMENSPRRTADKLGGFVPEDKLETLYDALCAVVSVYEEERYNNQKEG